MWRVKREGGRQVEERQTVRGFKRKGERDRWRRDLKKDKA